MVGCSLDSQMRFGYFEGHARRINTSLWRIRPHESSIIANSRILFIARRFPPTLGGIQRHCFELHKRLATDRDVRLVALDRQSLLHLIWFLPFAFVVTLFSVVFRKVDVVYFGDGVAGAMAPLLRHLGSVRFVVTIYALEMTYGNWIARTLMKRGALSCDRVVAISQYSRQLAVRAGIPEDKIEVVYVGIEPLMLPSDRCRELAKRFEDEHGMRFSERVLLNFGRLIPRKGVAAFLEKGMLMLDPDIKVVVCGGGPDFERIAALQTHPNLRERLVLVGHQPEEVVAMLRQSADLFLFPNIPTPHDAEGFGMTQLEGMYAGLPVVAFAVDAIVESVREGGYLVEPNNYPEFVEQIHRFYRLSDADKDAKREEAKEYVRREYSWDYNAFRYLEILEGGS